MEFTLYQFRGTGTVRVSARVSRQSVTACFRPDQVKGILWPAFTGLQRRDEIWRSTCFELFIGLPTGTAYTEINASPSGDWNCYDFDSCRTGMRPSETLTVTAIETVGSALEVRIRGLDIARSESWQFGVSAVIQKTDDGIEYYALSHGKHPDFHDPSRHVLVDANDL